MGPFWTIDPLRERVPADIIARAEANRNFRGSRAANSGHSRFAKVIVARSPFLPLSLSLSLSLFLFSFCPPSLFSARLNARPRDAAHAKRPAFLRGSNLAGIIPRDGSIRGEAVVCILSRAREWLFSAKVCPIFVERDRRMTTMTIDT
jgi:hypothetical protein